MTSHPLIERISGSRGTDRSTEAIDLFSGWKGNAAEVRNRAIRRRRGDAVVGADLHQRCSDDLSEVLSVLSPRRDCRADVSNDI